MATANALRLNGQSLQWFDGTVTRTRTGNPVYPQPGGVAREGALYIPSSDGLTYIDIDGTAREALGNNVAAQPAGTADKALRLPGQAMEYISGGRVWQVTEVTAPTEYPRNLSLDIGVLTSDPWDARVNWTNDTGGGTSWASIHVEFSRFPDPSNPSSPSGVVETFTYTNTSTTNALTTQGFWYPDDTISVNVWYEDSNGNEGPIQNIYIMNV